VQRFNFEYYIGQPYSSCRHDDYKFNQNVNSKLDSTKKKKAASLMNQTVVSCDRNNSYNIGTEGTHADTPKYMFRSRFRNLEDTVTVVDYGLFGTVI
jgi:hypothetical protein